MRVRDAGGARPRHRRLAEAVGETGLLGSVLGAVGLAPATAAAQERPWDWGMSPMWWWMWGASGVVMMLMMVAVWGLAITAVVVAVRWLVGQRREPGRDRAPDILRERYARGEISREEFEARRRDLA